MFVPVVAGSDKTTVSIVTGYQEYHPVYMSPGNLTNIAQRAHGNALLPVAFLPIPKSKSLVDDKSNMNSNSIISHQETPEDS
jgi:Plavaka transposase